MTRLLRTTVAVVSALFVFGALTLREEMGTGTSRQACLAAFSLSGSEPVPISSLPLGVAPAEEGRPAYPETRRVRSDGRLPRRQGGRPLSLVGGRHPHVARGGRVGRGRNRLTAAYLDAIPSAKPFTTG